MTIENTKNVEPPPRRRARWRRGCWNMSAGNIISYRVIQVLRMTRRSQAWLADELGMKYKRLNRWITTQNPEVWPAVILPTLSEKLGCSISFLVGKDNAPFRRHDAYAQVAELETRVKEMVATLEKRLHKELGEMFAAQTRETLEFFRDQSILFGQKLHVPVQQPLPDEVMDEEG